ncbi:MAG: tetratricopeptide repeat protein [Flavobacteriaceae bacterium]
MKMIAEMKTKIYVFLTCFGSFVGMSQEGKVINHIYDGNQKVESESFIQAEKEYRKALSIAPEKTTALYNLGNTHFLDKQYNEASQRFFQTQKFASSKEEKQKAFHNMGNVYMEQKDYQKAVEAYKNALRNNPSDDETRYNYALAKELLEKEKPPEEQEQDDKKDQQDQQQEEDQEKDKDQEGDQENQEEQDPNKEGDEGQESQDEGEPKNEGDQKKDEKPNQGDNQSDTKKQPPKQGQLSPQQVQSLLEAMNNQEKKVQDKVNAKKVKGVPVRGKKDW